MSDDFRKDNPNLSEEDRAILQRVYNAPVAAGSNPMLNEGPSVNVDQNGDIVETDEPQDEFEDVDEDLNDDRNTDENVGDDSATDDSTKSDDLILGKFKDHDAVVKAYAELEKKLGQQAKEIGDYRRTFDQMIQNQPVPQPQVTQEDESAVLDDFVKNPKASLAKVKAEATQAAIAQIKKMEEDRAYLRQRHPDFETLPQTEEFKEWIETNIPENIRAAGGDPKVAAFVFDTYKREKKIQTAATEAAQTKSVRKRKMNDAKVVTGKSETSTQKRWSRAEIRQKMLRDPDWYNLNVEAIQKAYLEGRVDD